MPPLPPIVGITNIDQVVDAVQSIVDWSKQNQSRLGYFAALYKRITIAIRAAIADGVRDRESAGKQHAQGDGGVDVTPGDRPDRVRQHSQHKAEGERDDDDAAA